MADEKRRNLRSNLKATLTLDIVKAANQREMESFEVEITDVSEGGIGFYTENQLMIGEIFYGVLTIWTKQKIDVVLKIVRSAVEEDGYSYGSIFVGLQNNDQIGIRIYQLINEP